jgi:His-Xaa-Ser system radical SAM maturase HxsB
MATTNYPEVSAQTKPSFLFPHRIKKIKDQLLMVADHGAWVLLTKGEYSSILNGTASQQIISLLESRGIIATEENIDSITEAYRKRNHFLFLGTALHIIIPTLRCNHQCIYCHSASATPEKAGKDMDEKTADSILNFIFQSPNQQIKIEFQGGEGLLNKNVIRYIIEHVKELEKETKKNAKIVLVTNLTLMDEAFLDYLLSRDVTLTTSLDGPEEVHNKNRKYFGGQGTYKDVVKWVEAIKQKKKNVGLLMVTTRHSLPFWKEIIDEYVRLGASTIQLKYLNKLGFADKEWAEIGYPPEEFIYFWKKGIDHIIDLNKKGTRIRERTAILILKKILTTQEPGFLDFRTPCGIVGGQMAYNHNGDIYSCDEGRSSELFRLGNVKETTYTEVFNTKTARSLISSSIIDNYLCDACVYKPFCGTCPVINYAEQGNIIPKLATNSRCKISKSQIEYIFQKLLLDKEAGKVLISWLK